MGNNEGMGRRAAKNGTELDDLLHAGKDTVDNNRNHAKAKIRRNKRVRREVRQALRNSQEG